MNPDHQEKLVNSFPTIFKVGKTPQEYFYFGFECGDGWFDLIWKLCENLIIANFDGTALQVKEKFGGLRFYTSGGDDLSDKLIDSAEDESFHICEVCGRKGKIRSWGWVSTLCFYHLFELLYKREIVFWYFKKYLINLKKRIGKRWTVEKSNN